MAYKAEIAVDVRGLKDVKTLETSLNKISGKINAINKLSAGNSKAVRVEKQVLNSKAAQADMMSKTRRIGDLVQKQADKGLKVGLAQEAISKSALLNSKKEFTESKRLQKVALDELKIQKAISKEIGQQAALKGKTGGSLAGGPFVSTGVASSRFGSVGQPGSPKFIASRAGAIQGPADPPFAPGMFPSSPIGGSKFMFGSPAQRAFSGGPSSSILGSKTTFGSPKFFDAAAKAGGPSVPVKGSKDIFGSPAYYDAANKEALRIAKANAMPIKGFKTLPGSPAFHEEQAKRLKRLRGAPTGFSAAEFGPQQPMQGPRMGPTSMGLNFDKRTGKLLRGPAGSGGGGFRNLARRFDTQSALISGGFPLLFGQGPGVAAAGALGGGIGGMFGQMGGFAGGIAATAAVQSIQNAVNGVAKLGQAFNKLNPDIEGLVGALGIAGTEEERRIRLIEQAGGKQAALNAITQQMNQVLGEEAVSKIKQFGEATQQIGNAFAVLMLKMQAAIAPLLNQIAKGIQGMTGMDKGRVDRLSAGAARSDPTIFNARKQIKELESQRSGAGRVRVKAINDEIAALNKVISLRKVAIADEKTANLERSNNNKQISLTLEDIEKENRLNQAILAGKGEEFQIEQQITDLIKQTGIEEEKLTKGQKDRIRNAVELNNKLEKQVELTKDVGSNFEIIGESIASGVSDNLTAAIQGTKTLGDAAKSILNDLSSSLIRLGVNTILSGIPGFGGLPKLLGFSKGGRPPVGRPSIVGEKGPELFVPRRSGTIIPNDKLGGGSTNINVNIDATGSSVEGDEQQSKELGRAISAAIQSELLKQRRPGGLLR